MNEILRASLPGLVASAFPTLMVLVGILLNQNRINTLEASVRGDMKALEASLRSEIASSRSETVSLAVSLRAEMAANRKQAHDDLLMLVAVDKEQSLKIARLERA